jgi:WD40 repeat protein
MIRLPRLRFSLRTLVIFVLLIGSGFGLWWRWEPWYCALSMPTAIPFTYKKALALPATELSDDGSLLFADSEDGWGRMFDVKQAKLRWQYDFGKPHWVVHASFTRKGQLLAPLNFVDSRKRLLFDCLTGQIVGEDSATSEASRCQPPKGLVNAIAPDGTRKLERCLKSNYWRLIDPRSNQCIANIASPEGWPMGSAFSPDSSCCATASYDGKVRILRASDGVLLCAVRLTPRAFCYLVEFSRSGDEIIATRFHDVQLYRRRRPEYWWGLAWLPEFWATLLFAGAFGWSVWRDRRQLRVKAEPMR